MGYFLYDQALQIETPALLRGEEAVHLLGARRIKLGEEIELQDPSGCRFLCRVLSRGRKEVELLPFSELSPPPEPKFRLVLHQAMVKEKALDFILQKATELGAAKIHLFESEHSQRLPEGKELERKTDRWQKILWEACKQSGRAQPPELALGEACPLKTSFEQDRFVFDPYQEGPGWPGLKPAGGAHLILGPEAGFTPEELQPFEGYFLPLGPRILRAETAALASLAIFGARFGDLA